MTKCNVAVYHKSECDIKMPNKIQKHVCNILNLPLVDNEYGERLRLSYLREDSKTFQS